MSVLLWAVLLLSGLPPARVFSPSFFSAPCPSHPPLPLLSFPLPVAPRAARQAACHGCFPLADSLCAPGEARSLAASCGLRGPSPPHLPAACSPVLSAPGLCRVAGARALPSAGRVRHRVPPLPLSSGSRTCRRGRHAGPGARFPLQQHAPAGVCPSPQPGAVHGRGSNGLGGAPVAEPARRPVGASLRKRLFLPGRSRASSSRKRPWSTVGLAFVFARGLLGRSRPARGWLVPARGLPPASSLHLESRPRVPSCASGPTGAAAATVAARRSGKGDPTPRKGRQEAPAGAP